MSPILVYVASPYSSDPEDNTNIAIDVGNQLLDLGFVPYVPHLTHFMEERKSRLYREWLAFDLHWIRKCDCVSQIARREYGSGFGSGGSKAHWHSRALRHGFDSERTWRVTPEEIDKLEAGRRLDATVHQQVFGMNPDGYGIGKFINPAVPHYSTDPAAMIEVVEKMGERFPCDWVIMGGNSDPEDCEWGVDLTNCTLPREGRKRFAGYGDTLPLAVARAALKAVLSTTPPPSGSPGSKK